MKTLGISVLVILTIITLCVALAQVSAAPSTPFLIYGYVLNESGSECNGPVVNITNINISKEWAAETNESSNYYQIMLACNANVSANDTLQFNVISPDGNQSNITEHTVTQDDIDNGGLFNYNITLVALNMPPIADPNGPYAGAEGTEISFNSSGSYDPDGSIVSYDWDFGDGNTSTEVSPVHTYAQNGTYPVNLTVTDNDGDTDTATTPATISDTESVADFTATTTAGPEPLTVTFTDTSTSYDGITAWAWDFNNDSTVDSIEENPTYIYTENGTYTVTLKVSETDGNSDTETKIDYINVTNVNQAPVSDPNGPYAGAEGTEISFNSSGSYDPDGSIVSYDWDFGDGNTSTEVSPVHTYAQNGTYPVNLTVTDNDGDTDTATTPATISDTESVADFTATTTAGPEPLTVTFTDTSTSYDGITAWAWDFNNDSTVDSIEENPTYIYTENGTYTVTLKVSETDGNSDTETKIDYINVTNVNQAPVSDPNGPYAGAEGTEISFNSSGSYDPDGSIVSYDWDFGDGNTSTEVSPVHTYAQNGTYPVNLTVTDNDGDTDTATTPATISDTESVADFTATTTAGPEPLTVTFTDTSTSYDGITAWAWDFNNDSTVDSIEENPTYIYTENGTYTVTLKVSETDGNSDTETKIDYINVTNVNQAPVSDPNGPYAGAEGTEISFNSSGSYDPDGSIVSYDWDFGDGNTSTEVSPVHTYAQNGTYPVNLTVTDNDGDTDTATTPATISDTESVADFTATTTAGPEPLTVTFTDTSTSYDGITAWAWDFNNDSTVDSIEENPTYIYTENGTYTVTLKVSETDGNSDTETKIDYINVTNVNQAPVSDPNGPYAGAEGTEISFNSSGSYDPDGSIVSYDWDFGDGNTSTEVSPVHTYAQNGTYPVNLTVTDNDGDTDTATTPATISDTEPVADFTATTTAGPEPLTVTFTDTSTSYDGITAWAWDFNNDSTVDSIEENPTYIYTENGTYTVTLKVSETDGNSDTETKIDYINVTNVNQAPVSDPNGPYAGAEGTEISFNSSGSYDPDGSIVSYDWDFGDGNTSTEVSPVHTYAQNGTYPVNLTVTDNDGDTDTATTPATISDTEPVADFTATTTAGPEPLTVTFTDTSTSYDGITAWAWDFNNDSTVDSIEENPTYIYTENGTYTVTLKVSETDGNSDTETKIDYINVTNVNQAPVSDPNGPYTGTEGISLTFDGSGSSDPEGSISYSWDFGDGNTATGVTPVHTYSQNGTYTVTLTVTDSNGAADSNTSTATIEDTNPVADFTATPIGGSEPLTVVFTDTSTSHDSITAWEWDFNNDGTVDSTDQNPTHVYTLSGTYTVALTVRETDGDSDTITKTDYIIVSNVNQPPVSDPNGPYTDAEGISITFDGSGSSDPDGSIVSYDWNFGDGNTGTGVSPGHTYTQNGTYTVTLTVTDDDGVTDTSTTTATITDVDPVANFEGTPTTGSEPLTVSFSDTSTSHDGIIAWAWDFNNDGTVDSTDQNPTHVYTLSGTYTVALTVRETDGDSDTITKTDYITVSNVNQPPVSDPNGPYTDAEGISITFDGSGSSDPDGSIVSYDWNFGDGNTGTGVSPGHTYTQNGTYTVTLTVTDDDGVTDTSTTTATITDVDSVANFEGTPTTGSEPLTVSFSDTSTSHDGIIAWEWDFNNDGTVDSTDPNPTHVYTLSGTYTVALTVRETDGDSDTITKTDYITVTPPPDTIVTSIYVNETGWWRNGGLFNTSIIPIQHAINNATTIDVIYVYNGSYTENVIVNKQLTLIGEGTHVVTVTAAVSHDHVFHVTANDVNISGFTVTGATDSQMAGIYLYDINHCHIFNNNVSNNDCGIYLYDSKNNMLTDNTANSNNDSGIYLDGSKDNTLTDNTANSNNDSGIYLNGSKDNTLTGNNVTSNNDCGICLNGSKDNTLIGNNVTSNNNCGIYLYDSKNNNLTGNTVTLNNNWGIYLSESKGNLIYNNYFNNMNNACDDNTGKKGKNNIWNIIKEAGTNIIGGSYLGGNYWSDYAGADSDGDGLGDTQIPYNSSGNITNGGDYLPLVTEASTDTSPPEKNGNRVRTSGGDASGEAFGNIALKDAVRKYITKGTTVTYQFKEDANSIEFIKFDAKTNAGYVIATVETLKDRSTLVSTTPSGEVYQYMNILVGEDDYATDKNIANAVIRIKVAKSWIAKNDIYYSASVIWNYI